MPRAAFVLLLTDAVVRPAQAPPPHNNDYLASVRINEATGALPVRFRETIDTTEATTQPDLFDPSRDVQPFRGSGAEPMSCAAAPYDASARLSARLRRGRAYTIQFGGVNGAGALDFSFEFFPDCDGDEVFDEDPTSASRFEDFERSPAACRPFVARRL